MAPSSVESRSLGVGVPCRICVEVLELAERGKLGEAEAFVEGSLGYQFRGALRSADAPATCPSATMPDARFTPDKRYRPGFYVAIGPNGSGGPAVAEFASWLDASPFGAAGWSLIYQNLDARRGIQTRVYASSYELANGERYEVRARVYSRSRTGPAPTPLARWNDGASIAHVMHVFIPTAY